MSYLPTECGYCLVNKIRCDLQPEHPPCETCRLWDISCPPPHADSGDYDSDRDMISRDYTVSEGKCGHGFPNYPRASPVNVVPWMLPLDNLIMATQELLGMPYIRPEHSHLLPSYVQDLPATVSPENIEYLTQKGIFSLPYSKLCSELLVTFVHNVQPYVPLLDIEELQQIIEGDTTNTRVSLLLYYAILFSSAAFIDIEHIYMAGYSSRKQARKEFYDKAKMLYNLDVEDDPIVLIQSTLLLTYWHEEPESPKNVRYWLDCSISFAFSIGLHLEPDPALEPETQQLRRRLWWCLYTRDRLLAFTLKQVKIIKDHEFNISFPTMTDFEFPDPLLGSNDLASTNSWKKRYEKFRRHYAQIFIAKSKLCVILGKITVLSSSDLSSVIAKAEEWDQELEVWYTMLPSGVRYEPPISSAMSQAEKSLLAYQAWLKMIFLAARSSLHRVRTSHEIESAPADMLPQRMVESKLQQTNLAITRITENLDSVEMMQYFPTTIVAVLLPVVITHVLNIRFGRSRVWIDGFRCFHHCMKALEKLGASYTMAENVVAFLQSTVCGDQRSQSVANLDTKMPDLFRQVLTDAEVECFYRTVGPQ